MVLAACSASLPAPTSTPAETPTAAITPDLQQAGQAAAAFVDAINRQDYPSAFGMLEERSRANANIVDAESLRAEFGDALSTATAQRVTYQLRGGLLAKDTSALASLGSRWSTTQVGEFDVTGTLKLEYDGAAWRVVWTRDLIVPGLAGGRLILQREPAQRGDIIAADGALLAAQSDRLTLGVRRSAIKDAAEEAAMLDALSQVTGLSQADIQARYTTAPADWFVPIADLDEDTLSQRSGLIAPFAAVSARPGFGRAYSNTKLAPHVVGIVGPIPSEQLAQYQARGYQGDEQTGLSGVEGYLESTLAGQAGTTLFIARSDGGTSLIARRPLQRGLDVTLTISPPVQLAVQSILGQRRGAAVVLDARDGGVLAMVSNPSFDTAALVDPGRAEERAALLTDPERPLLNRAAQAGYPPGSTFKIVTMAAGLSEGVTQPDEVFSDPGYWDGLGRDYRKTCWLRKGHGRITLQNGLSASCNVVFYSVGQRLDEKSQFLLGQHARQFGFGGLTGVELAGEYPGIVPDPDWKKASIGEAWTPGDTVNMAIGQGFLLATPLQVAQMAAAIANDGEVLRPHVVGKIDGGDAAAQIIGREVTGRLALSQEALTAIQQGMAGVTTNGRLGTTTEQFSGFDYYVVDGQIVPGKQLKAKQRAAAQRLVVAGKSGTAQAPGEAQKPHAWFTAYAPAENPRVVVALALENAGEGSAQAAPLARQIIEAYFGLPLSRPIKTNAVTD